MNKWIKYILILGVAGIIAAFLVYTFYINKPHPEYDKMEAEHVLEADELYNAFVNNKTSSDAKYTGKVIQITGKLNSVEQSDTIVTVVFVYNKGMFGDEGIRCSFLPIYHTEVLEWKNDDAVTIKGYCIGYNETDVIIDKCSVVN